MPVALRLPETSGGPANAHLHVADQVNLHVRNWPDSAVIGIRLERQLSGDKLPYTAVEHESRICPLRNLGLR